MTIPRPTSSLAVGGTECFALLFSALLALAVLWGCQPTPPPTYPLVLAGGRVIDPETNLDAIRDIAIADGKIVEVSEADLSGDEVIDVSGLVVSPGFIDLHNHSPTPLAQSLQIRDGVTTSLELEAGAFPVDAHGAVGPVPIADASLLHFGASVSHTFARWHALTGDLPEDERPRIPRAVMESSGLAGPAFTEVLSEAAIQHLRELLNEGLDQGGLGIGLLLDYMSSAVSSQELRAVFEVAASRNAPVIVHVRRGIAGDSAGLEEILTVAEATDAPVHVCHIQANAMQEISSFLDRIRASRNAGVRVTTESFPYNAGSTAISAAVFSRDWRTIFAIDYSDVEWAATGERLTEETFARYQREQPGGAVIHHYNREEWTRVASIAPDVIIASDGLPAVTEDVKTPPFGAGTFSRILARYVRDEGALDLVAALRKMTIMPAQVLEDVAPALRNKGRIQVGADADLTAFDPAEIQDHATFAEPYLASTGVRHVLVGGTFVLRNEQLVEGAAPGTRVLGASLR